MRRSLSLLVVAACGGTTHIVIDGDGGSTPPPPPPNDAGADSTTPPPDSGPTPDGGPGDDAGPKDSGPAPTGWDGGFPGPITCPGPGTWINNGGAGCGAERWTIKTGTDTAAAGISLLPKLTTIQDLQLIPAPTTFPQTTRIAPTEKTVFALKDVRLAFGRLEGDSDYHLMLSDLVRTIITEIPFPGGCTDGSSWQCLISHARSTVDAQNLGITSAGKNFNTVVSVIGVGFFDPEHGQYGAAPNTIELHPLLGICFGAGCDPSK